MVLVAAVVGEGGAAMTMHDDAAGGANRLLASLPQAAYAQLLPQLEPVTLVLRQVLAEPGEPIGHVHFPTTAVVSLLTVLERGTAVETATVGNEGMVGLPLFLGTDRAPGKAVCQVAGTSLRLPAAAFRTAAADGPLHARLHRYTQALFTQVAQVVACNPVHLIEARCARWLLMTHDRVGTDRFPLTQEFLAQMLGVRRSTVTVAASRLQQAGLIRYRRGILTVVDRARLEAAACECYRVVADEFHRLLDDGAPGGAWHAPHPLLRRPAPASAPASGSENPSSNISVK